jgi:hypothetical protein
VRTWPLIAAIGGAIVGVATVLGTVAAFGVTWGELEDALWPALVVAALAIGLAAAVVAIVVQRRGRSEADQRRLDRLLSVLNRKSIRAIEFQDFHGSWPAMTINPVTVFVREGVDKEEHFDDRRLESKRARLQEAAEAFVDAEGNNGWPSDFGRSMRDAGYTGGQVEGRPDLQTIVVPRWKAIFAARNDFLDAFDALVETAKARRYDLDALARERHPKVVTLDDIVNADYTRDP